MNVTVFYTKRYENMSNWAICEYEPNSNPTCSELACSACPEYIEGSAVEGAEFISKRRKITCFGIDYLYNHLFRIDIGVFLCVNNAAVVVLTQKPPLKTR